MKTIEPLVNLRTIVSIFPSKSVLDVSSESNHRIIPKSHLVILSRVHSALPCCGVWTECNNLNECFRRSLNFPYIQKLRSWPSESRAKTSRYCFDRYDPELWRRAKRCAAMRLSRKSSAVPPKNVQVNTWKVWSIYGTPAVQPTWWNFLLVWYKWKCLDVENNQYRERRVGCSLGADTLRVRREDGIARITPCPRTLIRDKHKNLCICICMHSSKQCSGSRWDMYESWWYPQKDKQ